MIELTEKQMQDLEKPAQEPPQVLNPRTQELFVLVPAAEYEHLRMQVHYDDGSWNDDEMDQLRAEACAMLDSFGKDT